MLSSSFYVSNGDDAATLLAAGSARGWLTAVDQTFEDAAIQGVTICIASGDTGAQSKVADGQAHVQYPASDPWVLLVRRHDDRQRHRHELRRMGLERLFSFGGSPDAAPPAAASATIFPLPSYQVDAGVPASVNDGHRGRGVPDVSANASPNSGYPIILGGAPSLFPANGTSASAPLWAGLIAVLNAALDENVGFVNPVLYALGSSVFRDIVAEPGAADNSLSACPGIRSARAGMPAPGWGSPRGKALLRACKHFYGPAIAVNLQDDLRFGTSAAAGVPDVHVYNVGNRDLMILSVQRVSGSSDFSVLPAPATPLAIAPGAQVDFTVEFNPTTRGVDETATIRVTSNDPVTPCSTWRPTGGRRRSA